MRIIVLSAILAAVPCCGEKVKLGYKYFASAGGHTHLVGLDGQGKHLSIGAMLGYGTSGIGAISTAVDSVGKVAGTVRRMYANGALRLDVPVKIGDTRWPYLIAVLSYEHMIKTNSVFRDNGVSAFSKNNQVALYPGIGYEI